MYKPENRERLKSKPLGCYVGKTIKLWCVRQNMQRIAQPHHLSPASTSEHTRLTSVGPKIIRRSLTIAENPVGFSGLYSSSRQKRHTEVVERVKLGEGNN